ncbi:hypothetical protein BS78_05G194600 [Paspalum vaginatum]|nr:hypothetical protein BS78_05G194600 [Paspalum vaginatum]
MDSLLSLARKRVEEDDELFLFILPALYELGGTRGPPKRARHKSLFYPKLNSSFVCLPTSPSLNTLLSPQAAYKIRPEIVDACEGTRCKEPLVGVLRSSLCERDISPALCYYLQRPVQLFAFVLSVYA